MGEGETGGVAAAVGATPVLPQQKRRNHPTAVQGTNDNSILSKCSMAQLGYFDDPFLAEMVQRVTRRSPIINRGYYIRAKAVDHIMSAFLQQHADAAPQILSLGAGFDATFFRLKAAGLLPPGSVYFEVDFPTLIQRKTALIHQSSRLSAHLPEAPITSSDALSDLNTPAAQEALTQLREQHLDRAAKKAAANNAAQASDADSASEPDLATLLGHALLYEDYRAVGVDLCKVKQLRLRLQAAGLLPDRPTLVLSECVLTYVGPKPAFAVVKWSAEYLSNAILVNYEQIEPDDAFGHFMQGHFTRIGSALKGIGTYRTPRHHNERMIQAGFTTAEAATMGQFYRFLLSDEERLRVDALEPFDEHEEWQLKCLHYIICVAAKGNNLVNFPRNTLASCLRSVSISAESYLNDAALPPPATPAVTMVAPLGEICASAENVVAGDLQRFGHASLATANGLLLHGGMGGVQHQRQDNVLCFLPTLAGLRLGPIVSGNGARMHHTWTPGAQGQALLCGGRTSPARPCTDAWLHHNTDQWLALSVDNKQLLARWRHTCVFLADSTQGYLLIGGQTASRERPSPRSCDDPVVWVTLDVPNATAKVETLAVTSAPGASRHSAGLARHSHCCAALADASAVIYGGLDETGHILSDVLRVQRASDSATLVVQKLQFQPALPPRFGHKVSADVATATMLINHSVAAVEDQVYITCGGGNCFSFGTHFNQHMLHVSATDLLAVSRPSVPITTSHTLTEGAFAVRLTERQPFLVRDCAFGVATASWTAEHLSSLVGDREVSVHVGEDCNMDFTTRNFRPMYLRSMGKNFRKDVSNIEQTFPEVAAEFALPSCVPSWIMGEKLFSTALRVSSPGVQLWTHYDVMDNVLCNVRGRKRVVLFPPEQAGNLYLEGSSSRVVDIERPDLEAFPRFATAMAHALELILEPGDMLHIPALWCHNVRALEPCISVNVFWKHLDDAALYASKDLYGNKDVKPAAEALRLAHDAAERLQTLPADHAAFYGAYATALLQPTNP
ncbi:uncharacterized protein MONBRDRAFT_10965 [Monosiga brevicollis MX1]|uniref:tRNA wybutosine-synthesizing protein 4 n=1 Tax=Monosiga brevicollis TaxID=81824 RepID=A9V7T0_MONBE|nr:uncharacterized protein MONBRDRAFT_10965 [Monosiga brevicollis MX1]EDQ86430.1 predicted protein [Monosiga brevicollis MX1]|eukprot:XP_001748820.1 hypothetical protein [Monosiga brevicollis MX1]